MRIDDIVNITDSELVNAGYITEILAFADELSKVKREYLFISNDIDEIKSAIKKGAYAIIFSKNLEIIDEEIAWIKVENIEEALLKLLKYKLLNTTLYVSDEITIQIIKSINKDKRVVVLDKIEVNYLNSKDSIFVTALSCIKNISANNKILKSKVKLTILDYNIFTINYLYNDKKYQVFLPKIYIENLQKSLSFFEELKLTYQIKNLKLDRFLPVFINENYEKVAFGKSSKVVIKGIKKDKYFIKELNFIFDMIKYANVKFFDDNNIDEFFEVKFDFAVLIDCDVTLRQKEKKEVSLF